MSHYSNRPIHRHCSHIFLSRSLHTIRIVSRAAVLETAKELVACSLKNKSCIAYDILESATRSDVLMICETWTDAEALTAHEQAAHFVTLVMKIQGLASMKLEKFNF